MPILGPRHDYAHPVEADPAWSESYYFNAYDPASDSGFFTRIGIRPNEGTMDVSFRPGSPTESSLSTGMSSASTRWWGRHWWWVASATSW